MIFFFYCYGVHRDLPSFPTRRSSDLLVMTCSKRSASSCHFPAYSSSNFSICSSRRATERSGMLALQRSSRTKESGRRSEEHTSELQSQFHLVCRLLLEKKNKIT